MGVRLRIADVESGPRIRRSAAVQGRWLAPLLLLLGATRPRHARAARPHAGTGTGRRLRGHRLQTVAGAGAERAGHPVEPRNAGGRLPAALGSDTVAPPTPRPRRH